MVRGGIRLVFGCDIEKVKPVQVIVKWKFADQECMALGRKLPVYRYLRICCGWIVKTKIGQAM